MKKTFIVSALTALTSCMMSSQFAVAASSSNSNPYASYTTATPSDADDTYGGVIDEYGTVGTYGTKDHPAPPPPEADDESGMGSGDQGPVKGPGSDPVSRGRDGTVVNSNRKALVSFEVIAQDPRLAAGAPVTLGQVFAKGAVRSSQTLVAVIDGKRMATQVDKKANWSDGSLRHAIISIRMPPNFSAHTIVGLETTTADRTANAVGISELLGTGFDATVALKIDGRGYNMSARDLLTQIADDGACSEWGRECKRWLSGPLVSEWIIGGPLTQSSARAALAGVYFHVRAYRDESGRISRARVDTVIENDWAYPQTTRNLRYDATISVGESEIRQKNLKHYQQARWHKTLWWNGDPQLYTRSDTRYLQATRAISNYARLSPTRSFLDSRPSSFKPMTNGDQTPYMGSTGAQPAIGPLPRWTSTYVVSSDKRAFDWMTANDDAVGSYGFHYRDEQTGRPLEITRHPYVTIANRAYAARANNPKFEADLLPGCSGDCSSPYTFDISHHPSIGYVSYLVTGDYYYLEEMQFTAAYIELWGNESYRGLDKGYLAGAQGQVRGQAWSLRSISDAAFATPDSDPMKSYFDGLMDRILADYHDIYLAEDVENPLHVIDAYGETVYPLNGQRRVGIAPWQQDFFLWSVGHAAEQGFAAAEPFMKWLSQFAVGRMTDWTSQPRSGFCWIVASAYALQVRDSRDARDYGTITEVYKSSLPDLQGLQCNSQPMANRLSNDRRQYGVGEMVGYANSPTGFPSNFQPALAMASRTGLKKASEAWRIFATRRVQPDYRSYPNFAVVPR